MNPIRKKRIFNITMVLLFSISGLSLILYSLNSKLDYFFADQPQKILWSYFAWSDKNKLGFVAGCKTKLSFAEDSQGGVWVKHMPAHVHLHTRLQTCLCARLHTYLGRGPRMCACTCPVQVPYTDGPLHLSTYIDYDAYTCAYILDHGA